MRAPAIQFEVHGLPAPQGSKSFKGVSRAGHAIMVESSAAVKPWRQDVVAAAVAARPIGWRALRDPVVLTVEFYMPRPGGHPASKRTVPAVKPDLGKLLRSTEDAMTTAGIYVDDAQIVDVHMRKRYATDLEEIALSHEMSTIGAIVSVFDVDPADTWDDVPLDRLVAELFPDPALPPELVGAVQVAEYVTADSNSIQVGAALTPARARAQLEKARKLIGKRSVSGRPAPQVDVVVESALSRLGAGIGRADDLLIESAIAVHVDGPAVGVRLVLAESIGGVSAAA